MQNFIRKLFPRVAELLGRSRVVFTPELPLSAATDEPLPIGSLFFLFVSAVIADD